MKRLATHTLAAIAVSAIAVPASAQQSAPPAAVQRDTGWTRFGENDRFRAYYREPLSNAAGNVVVWVLYDYKEEHVSERSGRKYLSQKGQQEFHCSAATSRTVFFTWHSGRMGDGAVVYTGRTTTPWEPSSPGSIARALFARVCTPSNSAAFASLQDQDAFIASTLKKTAGEMNAQAPLQVDEGTRMMSAVALQKTITFSMRLTKYGSSEVDSTVVAQAARENLNRTVCRSKATRDLIDLGVKYAYLYQGNDGKLIARVVIDRYQC